MVKNKRHITNHWCVGKKLRRTVQSLCENLCENMPVKFMKSLDYMRF
jgi:hypothetical protein